mmetsp:Transcript_125544/g.298143  ORF Transcript_125544/g.298143 Transcript_125544/m.298143 type:complete len:227 (-) Transcript_125544:2735-3415(-)
MDVKIQELPELKLCRLHGHRRPCQLQAKLGDAAIQGELRSEHVQILLEAHRPMRGIWRQLQSVKGCGVNLDDRPMLELLTEGGDHGILILQAQQAGSVDGGDGATRLKMRLAGLVLDFVDVHPPTCRSEFNTSSGVGVHHQVRLAIVLSILSLPVLSIFAFAFALGLSFFSCAFGHGGFRCRLDGLRLRGRRIVLLPISACILRSSVQESRPAFLLLLLCGSLLCH